MAVNIHITIIELNALHTKRQNLFQELDAVIHLLMEAKHWGLRKSRNATSLNSRFKSLDKLKVKTISLNVFPDIVPRIGNSFINTMKNINHTRSSISDDIRNILCSSPNIRRAIPLILRLLIN